MKLIIATLILSVLLGCSFKKEHPNAPPDLELQQLDAIKIGSIDNALNVISRINIRKLTQKKLETKFLEAAITRGNSQILIALLRKGLSPYRFKSQIYRNISIFNLETYIYISRLNGKVISEIESNLNSKNYNAILNKMSSLGMSCEALIDLHSKYSLSELAIYSPKDFNSELISQREGNLIEFLENTPECKELHNSSLKNEWIADEILKIFYYTDGVPNFKYFNFLISLYTRPTLSYASANNANIPFEFGNLILHRIENMKISDEEKKGFTEQWLHPLNRIASTPKYLSKFRYTLDGYSFVSKEEFDKYIDTTFEKSKFKENLIPGYLLNRIATLIPPLSSVCFSGTNQSSISNLRMPDPFTPFDYRACSETE